MSIKDWTTAFGRWIRPWHQGTEPIELQRAILDVIESETIDLNVGTRLFPYDRLELVLRAGDHRQAAIYERIISDGWNIDAVIHERLEALGCRLTNRIAIRFRIVLPDEPEFDDMRFADRQFFIAFDQGKSRDSRNIQPRLIVRVLKGSAEQASYELKAEQVHLGRLPEVLDTRGHLQRRNEIAFNDSGEINNTVSRRHATILFDAEKGVYFLRDDGSGGGTRIFRSGRSIPVGTGPIQLRSGDEVGLGQALLEVQVLEDLAEEG